MTPIAAMNKDWWMVFLKYKKMNANANTININVLNKSLSTNP